MQGGPVVRSLLPSAMTLNNFDINFHFPQSDGSRSQAFAIIDL
jgi:hypothetical protein